MPVIPTGAPAWTRTTSFAHYGGHADKQNYLGRGAIDALTDVGAEEYSRAAADLAAAARTSPAFVIRFTCNDASPDEPTVHSVLAMIGVDVVGYNAGAAPGEFPGADRNTTGSVSFHFLTSYTDEYGVSGSFTPLGASACAETAGISVAAEVSGQDVVVRFTDSDGSPVGDETGTLVVW